MSIKIMRAKIIKLERERMWLVNKLAEIETSGCPVTNCTHNGNCIACWLDAADRATGG